MRGLARGLGSADHVSSPTFKISNVYKDGKLELHHFDFYRLQEAGIMAEELAEIIGDPDFVTVIEWGDAVRDILPSKRLTITFSTSAETARNILMEHSSGLGYLVENLPIESGTI